MLGKYAIAFFLVTSSSMACASTIGFDLPLGYANSSPKWPHSQAAVPSGYVGEILTGYVLSIAGIAPPVVAPSSAVAESLPYGMETLPQSAAQSVVGHVQTLRSAERGSSKPFSRSAGGSAAGSHKTPAVYVAPDQSGNIVDLPTGPQRLDFDDLKKRVNIVSTLKVGPATITNTSGGNLFVYHSSDYGLPDGGGICALERFDFSCTADLSIVFEVPITKLTFSGYFAGSTDAAFLTVLDGTETVFQGLFTGNDDNGLIIFDFSWLSRITSILIEDRSSFDSGGIAYGNFEFEYYKDKPVVSPVPLSASGSLLLGGLAALALLEQFARERRRRLALRMS